MSSSQSKKDIYPIVFRADASHRLGMGHLMRVKAIAESLPVLVSPILVMRDSPERKKVIRPLLKAGWKVHLLSYGRSDEEDALFTAQIAAFYGATVLITDLCYEEMIAQKKGRLLRYHACLRKFGAPFTVSIEDSRIKKFSSNAVIVWNSIEDRQTIEKQAHVPCAIFKGLRYFLCHKRITDVGKKKRIIKKNGRRVLVSMGGSDPFGITPIVVKALALLPGKSFEAKIILGAGMNHEHKKKILQIARKKGSIKLLSFSGSIEKELLWADVAIVGTGITKVEAAVIGTPTLVIPHAELREISGGKGVSKPLKDFLLLKSAICFEKPIGAEAQIAQTVIDLLRDYPLRKSLSCAGKAAVDGKGIKRIYEEILKNRFILGKENLHGME